MMSRALQRWFGVTGAKRPASLSTRIALMFAALFLVIVLVGLFNLWRWGGDSAKAVDHDMANKVRVALAIVRGDMDRFSGIVPTLKGRQADFMKYFEYDKYESVSIMLRDAAEIAHVDLLLFATDGRIAAANDDAAIAAGALSAVVSPLAKALSERVAIVELPPDALASIGRPSAEAAVAYAVKINLTDISGGTVASIYAFKFLGGRRDLADAIVQATDAQAAIFDSRGKAILSSAGNGQAFPLTTASRMHHAGQAYFVRRVALPAFIGDTPGELQLMIPTRSYDEQHDTLVLTVVMSCAGLGLAGMLLFGFLRTQVMRPVRQLVDALQSVTRGDLSARLAIPADIPAERLDELQRMQADFNHMMVRLQGSYQELNQANAAITSTNAELEEANQRLRQLDKLKSDFLSSVSHELRTPLTSIRGFASLIDRDFSRHFAPLAAEDPDLQKKSRRIGDNLAIIRKESERLTRLINDVLDLAKIEAGRIDWNDSQIDVAQLARDAINAVQGQFALKPGLALHCDLPERLPALFGDADRLQQVLVNLLNNAAKFTERGEVRLSVAVEGDDILHIEVCDTGSGFPPEDAERIFDKFQQSAQDDTLTDKPKGTGLGLTISREIVERHGGRIWAVSRPGEGSTFTIELPVHTAAAPIH